MAPGEYAIVIMNTEISGIDNGNIPDKKITDEITAKLTVVDYFTLDENSTTAPESANDAKVLVKRTINANEWSTICLPFAMTTTQVKAAFGNDVQLGDFTGYDTVEDAGNVVGLKINFNKVTAIAANHPYVIKVSTGVTQFTADNVTIAPEDEPCVEYDNGLTGKKRVVWGSFTGTYVADYEIPYSGEDISLFLSGNKMYYASAKTKHMKAYRACFWFSDVLPMTGDASAPINMSFDGGATGIEEVKGLREGKDNSWYSLYGRKLEGKPVQKGLYIHNGNQEIIK